MRASDRTLACSGCAITRRAARHRAAAGRTGPRGPVPRGRSFPPPAPTARMAQGGRSNEARGLAVTVSRGATRMAPPSAYEGVTMIAEIVIAALLHPGMSGVRAVRRPGQPPGGHIRIRAIQVGDGPRAQQRERARQVLPQDLD